MVNFNRIEPLPHLAFERESPEMLFRPRRPDPTGIQPRPNRRVHAQRLKDQTVVATSDLAQRRASSGVAPDKFLVLRLETIDAGHRDTLERLNVAIVEELREVRDGTTIHRLLVQFPDADSLSKFRNEFDEYADETPTATALPFGKRRDLFDVLESISSVSALERTGRRLKREGPPDEASFHLDVDLWNPGTDEGIQELSSLFRAFVESHGGKIVRDPLIIPSLFLVKVEANGALLQKLLQLDLVALVDLPPVPSPEDSFDWLTQDIVSPDVLPPVPTDGPRACVVDSGVLAGHPLLRDVVASEEDFDSGEGTPVDLNGHGTQVAGTVVYGDLAHRLQGNEWLPQVNLYSAKVLRNDPASFGPGSSDAAFPAEERIEEQLKRAIEHFHQAHNCRVFNLSIGHSDRIYEGGRQLPWAELLDDLARSLDIVIVVSAGNVSDPDIPDALHSTEFRERVADSLKEPRHRLIDPATSALSLTVGAVARRDDPSLLSLASGTQLSASAQGCPSPFTRSGPGVAGAVKPEVVAPGGNFGINSVAGSPVWRRNDPNLGEPTLNLDFGARMVRGVCGTSVAAGRVTHIAARMEAALRRDFQTPPSQNLVRALLVSSARTHPNVRDYFGDRDGLHTVGYGEPNVDYCWSTPNRVSLVAEDVVKLRSFHVYSLVVPQSFLSESGRRSISVSLAYDPPTRLSRRDYISTAMWLEVFGGLTTEQVFEYRSKYEGDGKPPKAPTRNVLRFQPAGQTIRMSTVQKRSWNSNRGTMFLNRQDPDGDATMHILVGCQQRFPNPAGEDSQRYALVVTLEHESQSIDVYQQVQARARTRARIGVAG